MTALVLGGAWTALALGVAWRLRPPPARARGLAAASHAGASEGEGRPSGGTAPATTTAGRPGTPGPGHPRDRGRGPGVGPRRRARPDVLALVGGAVLGLARLRRPVPYGAPAPDPATARVVGTATVAAVVAGAVALPLAPLVGVGAWAVPHHRARSAELRRLRRLEAALPETVDLLVLAVGAGLNVPLAVAAAGRRGSGPLAAELRRVAAEVACGRRLADALDDLPRVAGEPARPVAGVLAHCERYGTPALPALQRLSDEVRVQRQRRAEAAARRVPVTLLFPLVLCILPAFALLTVAPLVAGALRELRLSP